MEINPDTLQPGQKILVKKPFSSIYETATIIRVFHPIFFEGCDVKLKNGQTIPVHYDRMKPNEIL